MALTLLEEAVLAAATAGFTGFAVGFTTGVAGFAIVFEVVLAAAGVARVGAAAFVAAVDFGRVVVDDALGVAAGVTVAGTAGGCGGVFTVEVELLPEPKAWPRRTTSASRASIRVIQVESSGGVVVLEAERFAIGVGGTVASPIRAASPALRISLRTARRSYPKASP